MEHLIRCLFEKFEFRALASSKSWVWWAASVILTLGRQREEDPLTSLVGGSIPKLKEDTRCHKLRHTQLCAHPTQIHAHIFLIERLPIMKTSWRKFNKRKKGNSDESIKALKNQTKSDITKSIVK